MEKVPAVLGNIFVIVPSQGLECQMRFFYVCTFPQCFGISYGLRSDCNLLTTIQLAALNFFQLVADSSVKLSNYKKERSCFLLLS